MRRMTRRLRAPVAVGVTAALLGAPLAALAVSVPLRCPGVTQTGLFQRLPIEAFRPVPSVRTSDQVTSYALDASRPQRVLATNGNTVKRSDKSGCRGTWEDVLVLGLEGDDAVPLSGVTSTIVATAALPGGAAVAAVREGSATASRPHVVSSPDGTDGSWRETSTGLPAQGAPRLLEPAGDGRTVYLTISSATDGGGSGGTLPTVPGVGGAPAAPAGLLYASGDGGRTWEMRTTVQALPAGATGFDALSVDPVDPDLLYAVSNGRFLASRDGGRTFRIAGDVAGVTAVEAMDAGEVAVLAGTLLLHSRDGGETFAERGAPAGATSAAYRKGDGALVVEADGRLFRVEARGTSSVVPMEAGGRITPGSARGDRATGGTFHARAGNVLLRYVDPVPMTQVIPPQDPGDLTAPPPPPARMEPANRSVTMQVGQSRVVDFRLRLPEARTPLDLYLLIDTSRSMKPVLDDLKRNLLAATNAISRDGVDLRVGIGAIGIGPRPGELPYPEIDPQQQGYRKPVPYSRVRAVGRVDRQLFQALAGIQLVTPPTGRGQNAAEGQLLSLEQLVTGSGIESERSVAAVPQFLVAPGQQAGFRPEPGIRKIVVHATNEVFNDPYGTPRKPDGSLDKEGVARLLAQRGIQHVGLAVVGSDATDIAVARPDLRLMSRLTGTLTPSGGIDCGGGIDLTRGAPLTCDTARNASDVLARVVRSLADRQSVTLVPRGPEGLVAGLEAAALRDLDVTVPNDVPFQVRVSCVDVAPGSYAPAVDAVLRGTKVATASIALTCTPAPVAAVAPPRPEPLPVQEPAPPAGQPAAPAPAPPAPAPAVQAQPQPQAQTQIQQQLQTQPLTAAALQQQEEVQLALALLADERTAPGAELAMVDRRRSEELRALALLTTSMAAASAFGLARLRTRRVPAVRRAR